jgi:hypothetical protein
VEVIPDGNGMQALFFQIVEKVPCEGFSAARNATGSSRAQTIDTGALPKYLSVVFLALGVTSVPCAFGARNGKKKNEFN